MKRFKLTTIVLLLALAACTQGGLIDSFGAQDTTVTAGAAVQLEWRVDNPDTLTLNPAVGNVSGQSGTTVFPAQTTTYELEARQGGRSDVETLTVEVGDAPVIADFAVAPLSVSAGTPAGLNWSVEGAESVTISPAVGSQPAQGRAEVIQNSNGTYTYTLVAENDFGTASKEVILKVGEGPIISSFTASPEQLEEEGNVELSWTVRGEGTLNLTLDDGNDDVESGADDRNVTGQTSFRVEDLEQSLTFTLTATDDQGTTARSVTVRVGDNPPPPADGVITLLIAGQSNASSRAKLVNLESPNPQVRMLGNDYVWKQATEPTDSNENQEDGVSRDAGGGFTFGAGHSFGVTLGKALSGVTGEQVYLIQASKGGSCVDTNGCGNGTWQPQGVRNRSTLFGSANYRAQVSAGNVSNPPASAEGGPVTGIVWYQGESDQDNSGFIGDTDTVMDTFMAQLDRPDDNVDGVPVIYVQLAQRLETEFKNEAYQRVREYQRQMETNFGIAESRDRNGNVVDNRRDNYFMVVAHDLPMDDVRHLSAEGQKMLGERIALAYQEHVQGSNVDGTGPRLVSILRDGQDRRVIRVKTTQVINRDSAYENYFTVTINGSEKTLNDGISEIRRDPSDNTAVRITLTDVPAEGVQVIVRYRPPTEASSSYPTSQRNNVVKSQFSGLPLPAFGGLTARSQ